MKHGSILIYSLLIMSVILAISLSLNAAFLRNLGNIREAQDSMRALYAADGGVEYCLYEARTGEEAVGLFGNPEVRNVQTPIGRDGGITQPDGSNQREQYVFTLPKDSANRSAEFAITNLQAGAAAGSLNPGDSVNDCLGLQGDSAFGIRSTGTFRSSNRSLEISYE